MSPLSLLSHHVSTQMPSPEVARAMLGTWEILAILGVVVLMFGATKLPQLGKGLGEAIGNFKKAQKDAEREVLRDEIDATPRLDRDADKSEPRRT